MKNHVLIVFFLLSSLLGLSAVHISVLSSEYRNTEIIFYRYADYITKSIDTLAVAKTDDKGAFDISVDVSSITEVFVDLERYKGVLFISPNKKVYQLKLPDYQCKTKAEELNIFFEPQKIHLLVENEDKAGINRLIASFNRIYDEFVILNFDTIYYYRDFKIIDEFENFIREYYSEYNQPYFTEYIKYKVAELRFLGPNRSSKSMINMVYKGEPLAYSNPSYMNLFNLMFDHFFMSYQGSINDKDLMNIVMYSRSPKKIKDLLKSDFVSNDTLACLIMLKGIHDELFYSKNTSVSRQFPTAQLMLMVDSVANYGVNHQNRMIAKNIYQKMMIFKSESIDSFDGFVLEDMRGTKFDMKDLRGKYVYVNIVQTDIFPAMEGMDRLKAIYKKHKDDIEIVSIFTDKDKTCFNSVDSKKYPWTLLYLGYNNNLLKKLRFVTWPQYHLIDPYGKLIISPAPSPQENFEQRFFEILDSCS